MPIQRFKLTLNQARVPMNPSDAPRSVLLPQLDIAPRSASRAFFGAEENADFDVPNVLYGENFVPWSQGIKSVSYAVLQAGLPSTNDFDQIFPLRDEDENQVLFSPSNGKNYVLNPSGWIANPLATLWAAETPPHYLSTASTDTPASARISRAYVDGKTLVAYSNLALSVTSGGATKDADGSIYLWNSATLNFTRVKTDLNTDIVRNLGLAVGEIGGISNSNGYLLVWSGLTVFWAPFDGTSFDFTIYANGALTGAGNQIPEDLEGPITSIRSVSGGFIIFTNKNAVAAFYNANNFASPWIFKRISNGGGLEDLELSSEEGAPGSIFAYTSGGLQRISLNSAEPFAPDVTDFLGSRKVESFDPGLMQYKLGMTSIEFFVKMTYVGSRFLVVSYGFYPGIYSFALIYDVALQRWGKLRIAHRDAFGYVGRVDIADVTYSMLLDVSYDDLSASPYSSMEVQSSGLTYPRQALAFLLADGTIKLAVMDFRSKEDDSEAFLLIGKLQLSRSSNVAVHCVEVEGLVNDENARVAVVHMPNGVDIVGSEEGFLREQSSLYSEYGIDLLNGKTFAVLVQGVFRLSTLVMHASPDATNY